VKLHGFGLVGERIREAERRRDSEKTQSHVIKERRTATINDSTSAAAQSQQEARPINSRRRTRVKLSIDRYMTYRRKLVLRSGKRSKEQCTDALVSSYDIKLEKMKTVFWCLLADMEACGFIEIRLDSNHA
jgi:hypothetical protein